MYSFFDSFRRLFSSEGFVPRRVCGLWPDWLVWEHVAGNALVWIAYFAMPLMIWRLGVRRPDWPPFKNIVRTFALFIGLCGLGHFLDMLAFFYPMYRLSGLVLITTGLVSCWTAWSINTAWPVFLALKSPADFERVIAERTTELTRALDDLRLAETGAALLASIVESSDDAIMGKDLDGIITTWNRGAERLFGYSAAEAIGRPMTFLFPTGRMGEESVLLERLQRGEIVEHFEAGRMTKDGRLIDVSLTISPIKDHSGRIIGYSKIARDITDRKHAEEIDRAYLATLVESSDDAIMGNDIDGVVTSWNRGAERLFGYTAAEAIGRPMTFVFPTERLYEEPILLERLRGGECVDQLETVRLTKDGRKIDVSMTISPIKDRSGQIVGFSRIARDITERKQAEAKTRLMNEELERLFGQRTEELRQRIRLIDQAQDAIMVRSASGVISSWNQGAERLYQWTREEATGRISHELLKTQFPKPFSEIEDELTRLGLWAGELIHERRDGVQVVVASRMVLDREGSVDEAVLEINSDVTERNLAIQRLKDSDARTAAILDAAADAILTIDEQGRIESLNPAAERLFGYPAAEIVGQNIKRLMPEPYHGEHDGYLTNYRNTGQKKIIGTGRDVVGRRKDGTTFPMQLAVSELTLGDRRMFTGIARDITEREKAEELLRRARDGAMAASRAKSEFLANMSHEIRTPMNGVLGMTELLLDTPLNDLQQSYAETIRGSGEALLTVINDILDFSKIEAGKLTLELAEFDLRSLMEEVADLLAPSAIRKDLKMSCRVDREVPRRLVGDPVRVRQVLTNLAGNAVKFSDSGEVGMEAHLVAEEEGRVTIRVLVSDTGIGIPEDRQADIFESFTQIEGGNSRRHGGTGLGLTICQSLVTLMGGRIGLESRNGEGSTFWFEVTLGKGHGVADLPANRLDGLRVLVVDDQEVDREILRGVLLSWECRPEVASSGAEALTRLLTDPNDDPFELIVLDHEMPGMNGEQTARVIKAMPRYAKVPIVLLSSLGPAGAEEVKSDLWAVRMEKPVRRSLFYNTLCRTVGSPESLHAQPPAADLEGTKLPSHLRILLAEDNEVNRQVAIGMVERLGCEVEAVWNGQEALDSLDYDRHDLILTDVQMPVMDGLTATAAIRERERGTGRHIPIIAMTAHAMQGDRERCLAAGMDGYVSKPIRPGPLREALLACDVKLEKPPIKVKSRLEPVSPTFFAQGLRESCGHDPKLTRKVLELMLKGVPVRLERLEAAIHSGDESQCSGEAHSLKGAFATVGAEALAVACQELMSLSKEEDSTGIAKVYGLIRNQWETLQIEANCYLETLTVADV